MPAPWTMRRRPDGVSIHGGFFLGPRSFYQRLQEMTHGKRP